ncbi:hypothetical protein HYV80_03100 [Candidatus Woesearchaeota archaeon]|nr:hypothetical protein [Candidatus Woesearchaeota archaeon]
MAFQETLIIFLVSLAISSIIIYFTTKLFGETEGIGTAILSALAGAMIYSVAYYFLGAGFLSTLIGGIAWLIALGSMYNIGWLKSLVIAVFVWVLQSLVNYVLPTATGPL